MPDWCGRQIIQWGQGFPASGSRVIHNAKLSSPAAVNNFFSLRLTVSTEKLAEAIERSRSCERRHTVGAAGEMATTAPGQRTEAAGPTTEREWPSDIVRIEPGECARPGPATAGAKKGARRGLAAERGRGFRQPARPPGRIWPSLWPWRQLFCASNKRFAVFASRPYCIACP